MISFGGGRELILEKKMYTALLFHVGDIAFKEKSN